jgi:hypothetical protein|tara:strand:- start:2543 stop:3127 length:585 start_codon:yes stop_codon:yes gene_type:complete
MINSEFYYLPNLGVLKTNLPKKLKNKLLKESKDAELNNELLKTGITATGVPIQFLLKDTKKELQEFIIPLVNTYFKTHPDYFKSINILNKKCDILIDRPWINLQRKHQYIPNHIHDGILSYNIFLKIPYNKKSNSFEFSFTNVCGQPQHHSMNITKKDEGVVLLFPSQLTHCVYPFYDSEEYRISIAGNVKFSI